MGSSPRQDADSASRSTRLVCAADPETPLPVLLDLAMEFPETVVHNPAFRVGLASNPSDLNDAHPIALACLITSPAMTEELEALIKELLRAAGLMPPSLMAYLDEWHSRGARRIAVDATAPAASCPDLKVDIERKVRGQCILARRLGWHRLECPLASWSGTGDFVADPPPITASLAGRQRFDSALDLLKANWFTGQHLSSYEVHKHRVTVNVVDHPDLVADDMTVIIEGTEPSGYGEIYFESGDKEQVELTADALSRVRDALAPWQELVKSLPDERILVVVSSEKPRVAMATLSQIRKGLVEALAAYEDLDDFEDNWDLHAKEVKGFAHLLTKVVPIRGDDFEDGAGDTFMDHLDKLPNGIKALGGKAAIDRIDRLVMDATFPPGTGSTFGTWGVSGTSVLFLTRSGDFAAVFCVVGWSTQIETSFELDPMTT